MSYCTTYSSVGGLDNTASLPTPGTYYVGKDNDWADDLMHTASTTYINVMEAREALTQKQERLATIRARAESCGAIDYSRDRIQSSAHADLSDTVEGILDAERDAAHAALLLTAYTSSLHYCMIASGFTGEQIEVWLRRYARNESLGDIARHMNITRSRVQYLLGPRAETALCLGINKLNNYSI